MDKIEIINVVPQFLQFYALANKDTVNKEERWKLWKEHDEFAAVPPGEEGQNMAQELLNHAWGKYQAHLPAIKSWHPDNQQVTAHLAAIKSLLGYEQSIELVVIYFVGGFENNPFVAPYDEKRFALCLPVENDNSDIYLIHELTHIIHAHTASLTGEWERSMASTILQEGLATQVSKFLAPDKPDEAYVEQVEGWLDACKKHRVEIFRGIIPFLTESSSDIVMKFTLGNGTTNQEREAYFVGWEVVRFLLEKEVTFKEIASIKEDNMADYLTPIIDSFINKQV